MRPITPEQKAKLSKAIDLAQGLGECSYAKGCIIAQLAKLEGADPSEWDYRPIAGVVHTQAPSIAALRAWHADIARVFEGYPRGLLLYLQCLWDSEGDVVETRARMRNLVEETAP